MRRLVQGLLKIPSLGKSLPVNHVEAGKVSSPKPGHVFVSLTVGIALIRSSEVVVAGTILLSRREKPSICAREMCTSSTNT